MYIEEGKKWEKVKEHLKKHKKKYLSGVAAASVAGAGYVGRDQLKQGGKYVSDKTKKGGKYVSDKTKKGYNKAKGKFEDWNIERKFKKDPKTPTPPGLGKLKKKKINWKDLPANAAYGAKNSFDD